MCTKGINSWVSSDILDQPLIDTWLDISIHTQPTLGQHSMNISNHIQSTDIQHSINSWSSWQSTACWQTHMYQSTCLQKLVGSWPTVDRDVDQVSTEVPFIKYWLRWSRRINRGFQLKVSINTWAWCLYYKHSKKILKNNPVEDVFMDLFYGSLTIAAACRGRHFQNSSKTPELISFYDFSCAGKSKQQHI